MYFNFQNIHFLKLQINEHEFPIKIKKVHQATLFQTLSHNIALMDRSSRHWRNSELALLSLPDIFFYHVF